MKVELNPVELEHLNVMTGGKIPPAVARAMHDIRRNLLLVGDVFPLTKHECAMVVAMCKTEGREEPPSIMDRIEEQIASHSDDIRPDDEITISERELLEKQNIGLNGEATGGEYKGRRIAWTNDFKSTPRTPVSKLEYGRPITYVSPKDGRERAGRFVRVNKGDRTKVNVMSSEMKKAFAVPMQSVRIVDLSPPSTTPRAVQI